jgi:signal transduction histidine kinase/ActR/RegA family two-component response regulator
MEKEEAKYRYAVLGILMNISTVLVNLVVQCGAGAMERWVGTLYVSYLCLLLVLLWNLSMDYIGPREVTLAMSVYITIKFWSFFHTSFNTFWIFFPMVGYYKLFPILMVNSDKYLLGLISIGYPVVALCSFAVAWGSEIVIHVSWKEFAMVMIQISIAFPISFGLHSMEVSQEKLMTELSDALDAINAANEAKTHFISNISHDLRTPLHAILGLITLLQNSQLDSVQESYINTMKSSCNILISIINNVLDFTKIEMNRLETNEKETDLCMLVQDIGDSMISLAEEKKLDFTLNIDIENDKRYVYTDPQCLTQILTNLIGNAIKFTEQGSVVLKMRAQKLEAPGIQHNSKPNLVQVDISVKDTGRGMSDEFLNEKLFEPFCQEHLFKNAKGMEGSGLGLSLCHRLVRKLGGDIKVTSQVGKGTEFYFSLTFKVGESHHETIENRLDMFEDIQGLFVQTHLHIPKGQTEVQKVIQKEVREWKGILKHPIVHFSSEPYVPGPVDPSAPAIHIFVEQPTVLNRSLLYLYGIDSSDTPSRVLKCVEKGTVAFLFISRLKHLQVIHSSNLYLDVNSSSNDPYCATLIQPLTPFKFRGALVKCISHINDHLNLSPTRSSPEAPQTNRYEHLNILIVEDNPLISNVVSMLFSKKEINYAVANNGEVAVRMFSENPGYFNIILMDIQMPLMNGFEATVEIRKIEDRLGVSKRSKIIFNSALANPEEIQKAKDVGADEYLTKPIQFQTLISTIEKVDSQSNDVLEASVTPVRLS